MMTMMDSSAGFSDSTVEQDEAAFPCKGCGEVMLPPLSECLTTPFTCMWPIADEIRCGVDPGRRKSLRTWYVSSHGVPSRSIY